MKMMMMIAIKYKDQMTYREMAVGFPVIKRSTCWPVRPSVRPSVRHPRSVNVRNKPRSAICVMNDVAKSIHNKEVKNINFVRFLK